MTEIAARLTHSKRGELEIVDVISQYLICGELNVEVLGRGIARFDAGTQEALLQAGNFVQTIEERQGLMIACLEEIAFRQGYIDVDQLKQLAESMPHNGYGGNLQSLVDTLD